MTLWVLAVRDWRVYGITLLWPSVIDACQTANLTLALGLLLAVAWRYRERELLAGIAVGAAIAMKFFLWPVAVWLLAIRKRRAAAASVAVAAASLLLLLPYIGLGDYVSLVRRLADAFDGLSYTPYALLLDLGTPSAVARSASVALGAVLLAGAWRRRSLGLALAAAFCSPPSCGVTFSRSSLVPLAIARPRFDAAWLVPLGMWVGTGTFNGAPWQTAVVLALAGLDRRSCRASAGQERPRAIARHRSCRRLDDADGPPARRHDRSLRRAAASSRPGDVRRRELRRVALRGLPERAVPGGRTAAPLGEPVPAPGHRPLAWAQPHLAPARRAGRRPVHAPLPRGGELGDRPVSAWACFMASLRIVGVRDWRVYGVFALWPQVIGEMRVSHLTPFLCLLLALAWRAGARRRPRGLLGFAIAVKFFVWPLGVWLASIGRRYAPVAVGVAGASLLLVLPFTGLISDYFRSLLQLGRAFDQDSYTLFGLLSQSGASETAGRLRCGPAACSSSGPRGGASFTLAIAAALTLSPIVWLDYFALAAVPLAIARPRLSAVWFLPLATWGLLGAGIGAETVGCSCSSCSSSCSPWRFVTGARSRAPRTGKTAVPRESATPARLSEAKPRRHVRRPGTRSAGRAGSASRAAPDPRLAARSAPNATVRGSGRLPSGTRPSRDPFPSDGPR